MNTLKRKKKSKSPTQRNLLDEKYIDLESIDASNLGDSSIERLMSVEGGAPNLKISGLQSGDVSRFVSGDVSKFVSGEAMSPSQLEKFRVGS